MKTPIKGESINKLSDGSVHALLIERKKKASKGSQRMHPASHGLVLDSYKFDSLEYRQVHENSRKAEHLLGLPIGESETQRIAIRRPSRAGLSFLLDSHYSNNPGQYYPYTVFF